MWNTFLNFFCKRDLNPVMNGKKLLFWILLRFRLRRVWLFWRREEGEWENVVQFSTPCRVFFFAYDQYIFPQSIWLFENLPLIYSRVRDNCRNLRRRIVFENHSKKSHTERAGNFKMSTTLEKLLWPPAFWDCKHSNSRRVLLQSTRSRSFHSTLGSSKCMIAVSLEPAFAVINIEKLLRIFQGRGRHPMHP